MKIGLSVSAVSCLQAIEILKVSKNIPSYFIHSDLRVVEGYVQELKFYLIHQF